MSTKNNSQQDIAVTTTRHRHDRQGGRACSSEGPGDIDALCTLLRNNPMFAASAPAGLREAASEAVLLDVQARTMIASEGDPASYLHVLIEGDVRVFHSDRQGRQVSIRHLSPPSVFGEMEILTHSELLGSFETLTPARIVRLPAEAFRAFLERHGDACRNLLHDVSRRFCVAARNEHAVFFEVETRLASLLLAYAELYGRQVPGGLRISIKLTQDDLANGLGVVVRSISRTLTTWRRNNWMSIRKGWYVIHDIDALRVVAAGLGLNLNYRSLHTGEALAALSSQAAQLAQPVAAAPAA